MSQHEDAWFGRCEENLTDKQPDDRVAEQAVWMALGDAGHHARLAGREGHAEVQLHPQARLVLGDRFWLVARESLARGGDLPSLCSALTRFQASVGSSPISRPLVAKTAASESLPSVPLRATYQLQSLSRSFRGNESSETMRWINSSARLKLSVLPSRSSSRKVRAGIGHLLTRRLDSSIALPGPACRSRRLTRRRRPDRPQDLVGVVRGHSATVRFSACADQWPSLARAAMHRAAQESAAAYSSTSVQAAIRCGTGCPVSSFSRARSSRRCGPSGGFAMKNW